MTEFVTHQQIPTNFMVHYVAGQVTDAVNELRQSPTVDNAAVLAEVASDLAEMARAVAQPVEPDLPEGLGSHNAYEFVPMPPAQTLSTMDELGEETAARFSTDEHGQLRVELETGESGMPRHQLLVSHLDDQDILALHRIIEPLVVRQREIERLTAAARRIEQAERDVAIAEKRAHDEASAFVMESMEYYVEGTHYSDRTQRLHRRSCVSLDRQAKPGRGRSLVTHAELVTRYLPAFRETFERLNSPEVIKANAYRVRTARHGAVPRVASSVVMLCGTCKPVGKRSKPVEEALLDLTGLAEEDPQVMVKVATLLAEIEDTTAEVDAAYRAKLETEKP